VKMRPICNFSRAAIRCRPREARRISEDHSEITAAISVICSALRASSQIALLDHFDHIGRDHASGRHPPAADSISERSYLAVILRRGGLVAERRGVGFCDPAFETIRFPIPLTKMVRVLIPYMFSRETLQRTQQNNPHLAENPFPLARRSSDIRAPCATIADSTPKDQQSSRGELNSPGRGARLRI